MWHRISRDEVKGDMQTIGITGGTGFLGHYLTQLLKERGYRVIIFTRDLHQVSRLENVKYSYWNPVDKKFDLTYLEEIDAVIHLAGAGIADKRWTPGRKREILRSRVKSTSFLLKRLREHGKTCKLLVSASAIGYYGKDCNPVVPFSEDDPPGDDFMAETCKLWEAESWKGSDFLRVVILRFGSILGRDGGIFQRFSDPGRYGWIPILGNGRQILSWIHIEDLCRLILFAVENTKIRGVYNAVAPYPVSQKRFMDIISRVRGGMKVRVRVPGIFLRIGYGELAGEILEGCTVRADKIQMAGFPFAYPDIKSAVRNLVL